MTASLPALDVEKVSTGYGTAAEVLHEVSFSVRAGEAVALLGANGAGKTTTLRLISGLLAPRRGEVRLHGRVISRMAPHRIARAGIAHVPEGRQIFVHQTVGANLLLGGRRTNDRAERLERMLEIFPILAEKFGQHAGELSGGQQQMLAIARGLMANPSVLMLDEPSLGLSPKLVDELTELLLSIRQAFQTSILLVEQSLSIAAAATDRAYVLKRGKLVIEESSDNLLDAASDELMAAYLG